MYLHYFDPINYDNLRGVCPPKMEAEQIENLYAEWKSSFSQRCNSLYTAQWYKLNNLALVEFQRYSGVTICDPELVYPDEVRQSLIEVGAVEHQRRYRETMDKLRDRRSTSKIMSIGDIVAWLESDEAAYRDLLPAVWRAWFLQETAVDKKRQRQLRRLPYREYLRSPYWKRVRLACIIAYNHRCQSSKCVNLDSWWGSEYGLNVHHLHYKNKGREQLDNLILLCRKCHEYVHAGELSVSEDDAKEALYG
jgi:hypothetical protein